MEINITLIGQLITFTVFVWFTMKFVWPPLLNTMKERQQRIAEGLAAAEQGQRALELAQQNVDDQIQQAKQQAAHIIDQASKRANQIVEESKQQIRKESERLLSVAQADIEQAWQSAQQKLQEEATILATTMAKSILKQALNRQDIQRDLIQQSLEEI